MKSFFLLPGSFEHLFEPHVHHLVDEQRGEDAHDRTHDDVYRKLLLPAGHQAYCSDPSHSLHQRVYRGH